MTDAAADTLPLAAFEIALNHLLALDPPTQERLAALAGRVIVIEVPTLGLSLGVVPHSHGVQLLSGAPAQVDVHIRGRLADLLQGQLDGTTRGLAITGDKHLASAFAAALRGARIDWAELLVPWLGDVAAERGVAALAALSNALREGAESALRSGAEFLSYEHKTLVSANEWESFRDDVRALHTAVRALERRVALLVLRLQ